MPSVASNRLFVVNGIFSFIHALASAPTQELEALNVLVLFQYDDTQNATLLKKIRILRPNAKVRFLKEPKDYIATLSDRGWMQKFCPKVTEIRMFYTHNYWLHNAVFGTFPEAKIILFEEGTASFYPGLWDGFKAQSRIEKVCVSEYLGIFKPMDSRQHAQVFKEPAPALLRTLLSKLPDASVELPKLDRPIIVLVEQYFHKKGNEITFDEMVGLYENAIISILKKGYDILYKGHPREAFGIWDSLRYRLGSDELARVKVVPREIEILEAAILKISPVAIVGVSSTSQLACPHLYGIPSFRIETNMPIRMSKGVEIERRGLVCNHLAQKAIFPTLEDLPTADKAGEVLAVFRSHIAGAIPNTEQAVVAVLAENNFKPELSHLIADITDSATQAVSFDVFDTLVWRPSLHPSDIFILLDKTFRPDLGDFMRFSKLRTSLFSGLRHRDRRAGCEKEEYSLRELYDFAGAAYRLPKELTERMQKAEMDLEKAMLQPRKSAIALFELSKNYGKKVVLTSDSYLTAEELSDLLLPILPFVPDLIITSFDEGVTKRTGGLFDVLLEKLDLPADAVTHFGDSKAGDVDKATAKNIRAHHFPAFHDCFKNHRASKIWDGQRLETGAKVVLGLFAGKFFDNPFALHHDDSYFDRSPFWLGYGAVGPMLLSWVDWILKESVDRGHDKLMFVARDGWVPLQIAQRLQADIPVYQGTECNYVFASRKAYMPVYQSRAADVAFTRFAHGLDPNTTSVNRALRSRFGSTVCKRFASLFEVNGFADLDAPIRRNRMDLFNEVLASIADDIVEMQSRACAEAAAYFKQEVGTSTKPAIVDIGYSGSSQRAFMLATNRRVDGYYLTIMEHNVEYSDTLAYQAYDYSGEESFFRNGAFIEYLITPCGLPECVSYSTDKKGKTVPVFGNTKTFDTVSEDIHAGIDTFINDVFGIFGEHVSAIVQRPAHASRMLVSFVNAPGKGDAAMFDMLEHEDDIGAARPNLLDYWPAGKSALE